MALDPLAERLELLLEEGSIESFRLSIAMRRRLSTLFEFRALVEEKAGGGRRVRIRDREAVERWVSARYPSGLRGADPSLPARTEAVANFRDSKAGRKLTIFPRFMRGFGAAVLRRPSSTLPLATLTSAHELVGVLVELTNPWELDGTLALVENLELFMHVEAVVPGIDAALWTVGCFDQRALQWIAGMPRCQVLHVGDYDPIGLSEYLRVRAAMPAGRASLFVPADFEALVATYGQPRLLERSAAVLERVRRDAPEELKGVLSVIDRHRKALEQEALLIGALATRNADLHGGG